MKLIVTEKIPKGWDWISIGNLFDFKNGLNKEKRYFGFGIPIINYMDVYKNRGLRKDDILGKVSLSKNEIKSYAVQKGDVFFTRTSETVEEVGISSVVLEELSDTVFSGFILRAHPKDDTLVNDFKKYCFSSSQFRKEVTTRSTYTTRALTNGRVLSSLYILIPIDKKEQSAIAEALSDIDKLISSLDALIAKKRVIKKGVMHELLTGERRLPGFSDDWECKKLNELGGFRGGNCFPIRYQGNIEGKYPFYKISDMNNDGNSIFMMKSNNWISEKISKELMVKVFPKQTIIFAKIGAAIFLERKKILAQDSCIDNNVMGYIVDKSKADYKFMHYLFLTIQLGKLVSATALPSLNARQIGELSFKLPEIDEQAAIAEVLTDFDNELTSLEQKRDKTKLIKQGMMQELLTGRIRLIKE